MVDVIPGGFTVSQGYRWWSVAWRGSEPLIADHLAQKVDPSTELGKSILRAIRAKLAAGS